MIDSDRTAILAILSRWQRHWFESSRLTQQKQEIEKYNSVCDGYFQKVRARIRLYANFTPIIRSIATASTERIGGESRQPL